MESNLRICRVFEQLRDLRAAQGEYYRSQAYTKVIPVIRSLQYPITSGAQAQSIPGIGESLSVKIDEILTTGTVAELQQAPQVLGVDPEKEKVIQLFDSIQGVGRVTAERWYNLGYRRIEDLPPDECTNEQWLGIKLKADLDERIPRDEIDEAVRRIHEFLDPYGIQFEVAGSYRRGKPDSGDIDIIVLDRPDKPVMDIVTHAPIFQYRIAVGTKKARMICLIRTKYRKIDVELAQPSEYFYTLLYFTGSDSLNRKMRAHAAQAGYRLNEKELIGPNGISYPAQSEEQIFAMMGLQYLTPQERDKY